MKLWLQDSKLATPFYFAISLEILLVVLRTLSLVQLEILPTFGRVTYYGTTFSQTLTGSAYVDALVMIAAAVLAVMLSGFKTKIGKIYLGAGSVTFLAVLLVQQSPIPDAVSLGMAMSSFVLIAMLSRPSQRTHFRIRAENLTIHLLIFWIVFEVLALAGWILYGVQGASPAFQNWLFVPLEGQLAYSVQLLTPYLLIALVFSFVFLNPLRSLLKVKEFSMISKDAAATPIHRINYKHVLLGAFALSVLLPVYSYLPAVNPSAQAIGVDVVFYTDWLNQLDDAEDSAEFTRLLFYGLAVGDRPASLLFMFALQKALFLDALTFATYLPFLLSPLTVVIVYFAMNIATRGNRSFSSIVSLLAILSSTFIVGIYSAFYANWLALLAMIVAASITVRFLSKPSAIDLLMIGSLFMLVLLLHANTFTYLILWMSAFAVVMFFQNRKNAKVRNIVLMLSVVIVSSVLVDVVKSYGFAASGGIERGLSMSSSFSAEEFASRWNNLKYNFTTFYGGFLANAVMYGVAIYGIIRSKLSGKNYFELLFACSAFAISVPLLFSTFSLQSRLIYDMPLFVLAGIGLYYIWPKADSPISLLRDYRFWLVAAILLHFTVLAFRAFGNMALVLPDLP